ncbi:AbrB/MazE/SpoVT family DNA-binding domain-containing protein, partial [Planctomycetota bacterium]
MPSAKVTSKGQITIPKEIRRVPSARLRSAAFFRSRAQ